MLISKFDTAGVGEKAADLGRRFGMELPEEYRRFLCRYNGGETPETSFRMARVSSDLRGFFGLGAAPADYRLEHCFDEDELSVFVSEGIFPIGKNSFGDLLFIGVKGEFLGKILFQYHDRLKSPITLADSLSDFAAKCKSKKIKPCRSIEERLAGRRAAGILDPPPPVALQEWQREIDHCQNIHQEELVL